MPLPCAGRLLVVGGVDGPVADCATTWKANVRKMLKSSTSERIENDILATATATANSAVQNGGNAHYK